MAMLLKVNIMELSVVGLATIPFSYFSILDHTILQFLSLTFDESFRRGRGRSEDNDTGLE